MGCFNYTCCVSGLPIGPGDEVRFLMLTASPYERERACEIHGAWFPRACPLKAVYNDYGSVEGVEEGPTKEVWLKLFQKDLVEKGIGDNSVHDVAVRKDMTFDALLDALWEERVFITRNTKGEKFSTNLPPYIPTLASVEAALAPLGLDKYLIDDDQGFVRIRLAGYSQDMKLLRQARKPLTEFATVITAGSGNYSSNAEIRVFVKPGNTKEGHPRCEYDFRAKEKPLKVRQAMIREDVWQALLAIPIQGYDSDYKDKLYSIEDYRKGISTFFMKLQSIYNKRCPFEEGSTEAISFALEKRLVLSELRYGQRDECPGSWLAAKAPVPFSISPAEHAVELAREGQLTDDFISAMAEFAYIQEVLMDTRYVWRPSDTAGPQSGDWEAHKTLHEKYVALCDIKVKEDLANRAQWDDTVEE